MGVLDEVRGHLSLIREADSAANRAVVAEPNDRRDAVTMTEIRELNKNTPVSLVEHDLTCIERCQGRADPDDGLRCRPIREVALSSLELVGFHVRLTDLGSAADGEADGQLQPDVSEHPRRK